MEVSSGFDVDKAATAEEGLKIVDRADLVLTDFKLPNMDGLQLLAACGRSNSIPRGATPPERRRAQRRYNAFLRPG